MSPIAFWIAAAALGTILVSIAYLFTIWLGDRG